MHRRDWRDQVNGMKQWFRRSFWVETLKVRRDELAAVFCAACLLGGEAVMPA